MLGLFSSRRAGERKPGKHKIPEPSRRATYSSVSSSGCLAPVAGVASAFLFHQQPIFQAIRRRRGSPPLRRQVIRNPRVSASKAQFICHLPRKSSGQDSQAAQLTFPGRGLTAPSRGRDGPEGLHSQPRPQLSRPMKSRPASGLAPWGLRSAQTPGGGGGG